MTNPGLVDLAGRAKSVKKGFKPGGQKGKLHREMGVPEGEKIPADRLEAATHSRDPEKRRDAIRAETMKRWHHVGSKGGNTRTRRQTALYSKTKGS